MSFHSKMWVHAHKTKFAGLSRIRLVAKTAVLDHNFSSQKASLLKVLKMDSRKMQDTDHLRHSKPKIKKAKKILEKVSKDYAPGAI